MLDIYVHDLLHVTVIQTYRQLDENVQCHLLRKVGLASRFHVTEQVSPRLPFGHNVDSIINLEVVNDSEHVFTLFTAFLSIDLRDV